MFISFRARDAGGTLNDYDFRLEGATGNTFTATVTPVTVAPTGSGGSEFVADAQDLRTRLLIDMQPDLRQILGRDATASADVTHLGADLTLGNGDSPPWATLSWRGFDAGANDGDMLLGAIGTHARLSFGDLGVMVQADHFDQTGGGDSLTSDGWMIGPDLVGEAGG